MFLKTLTISGDKGKIREIHFHNGLNLIVDETPSSPERTESGNNVGKTTVLRLIDFCFGAKDKSVFTDSESKKEYKTVREYLREQNIQITLVLTERLEDPDARNVVIERNFLSRNRIIRKISGQQVTEDEFQKKLSNAIFPKLDVEKPTFRQIISHNFRYDDDRINQTLRTLDKFSSDAEYETLHLFLLGSDVNRGSDKQALLARIQQEKSFRDRLEEKQTRRAYEAALAVIETDIERLVKKKSNLNLNENFAADLDALNEVKYSISKLSSEISKAEIRRDIILEAGRELEADKSNIDSKQLKLIYEQANAQIANLQRSFEELLAYHNRMIHEKVRFITRELPDLSRHIDVKKLELSERLGIERELTERVAKSSTYEDLERLVSELNEKYIKKGEYQNIITQLDEVEQNLENLNSELKSIDEELFSEEFESRLRARDKFNEVFASISKELYGEQYILNYDVVTNSKGQKLYKFSTFNADAPSMSSGKKQGEISCFDLAYILFADAEGLPTLHFVLNDKKELMHNNELIKIAELVERKGIQFVASILKDKLPSELNREELFVLKLSQDNKLFRIEA